MAILDKHQPQTVLVTGCSGYIGSHLKRFQDFVGIDRDQVLKSLEDFNPKSEQFQEVRHVIHLADKRLQEIHGQNLKSNVAMHEEFLKKISDLPRLEKIIFSSSCSVYGFAEETIDEDSPVNPTSHYAESKLAVERFLREMELPFLVFRFGTAYGWSENMRDDLFINEVAAAVSTSKVLDIFALETWRPYIHCRDFAAVLSKGLSERMQGILNVVSQNMTKKDILELSVLKNSALHCRITDVAEKRNYKVRIRQELIPNPCFMEEGIREMIGRYNARTK